MLEVLRYKVLSIGTRLDVGEGVNVGVGADVAGTEAGLGIRTVVGAGVGVEVKSEASKIREVIADGSNEVDAVDGDRPRTCGRNP